MSELINRQSKSNKSILYQLIYRVDGENFKKMTSFLWKIWKESGFSEVDPEINKIITENSPVFLDYRSDKTIGFHYDNATINWNAKTNTIDVKVTKGTGVFETNTVDNGRGGSTTETTEITETFEYSYHPFSPMIIFNADNPTFIFNDEEQNDKPYQFLPAFVLYAKDESAFWENWLTAGEYAVDVLTTLSGVGNILKFGRLYKVLQAGKKLTDSGRIFTKVVTGVKGVAGVAEISSGSINILLKLTGVADTELGREISKYLFWFEMAALSGELSVALHGKIQASASKILAKEQVLIESATNADEAKQIGKLVEELKRMANLSELSKVAGRVRRLGQKLSKSDFEEIKKFLKPNKVELEIHPLNEIKEIEGFFLQNGKSALMPQKAAAIFITDGSKMKIVLREEATVYEFFHEFMHFRHAKELGLENFYKLGGRDTFGELTKEQWVFDVLMKNKEYLTRSEIDHALDYLNNSVRDKFGMNPIKLDFDLSKIPEVRKEIKISEIFKIK